MRKRLRRRWERALARKRHAAHIRAADQQHDAGGVDPDAERRLQAHDRPPDVPDPRTKSTGHKQKTADKWNQ
jgi:hypothetical protein